MMTKTELLNRILLAWENPNCIWELDRKGGYVWKEDGMIYATPGVAVMCAGLDDIHEDRGMRAWELQLEWSYLMHMEQAINFLFCGNIYGFNDCVNFACERSLSIKKPIFFKFENIKQICEILK